MTGELVAAGASLCAEPWSEVVGGLFVGGHDHRPEQDGPRLDVVVADEFDLVISLYERDSCGPADGVLHVYLRLPDGHLTPRELRDVRTLADWAAEAVRDGRRVLCRCQAGLNRSSLVAALAMVRLGYQPDAAVEQIRLRRSPHALFNEHFQRYIAEDGKP